MTNETQSPAERPYFDLHIQGVGYLSQIREVTPTTGSAFLAATVSALWGHIDRVRYTHFECLVSGDSLVALIRRLQPEVEAARKVLMRFTLSDLTAEPFAFHNGDRAGKTGIRLKSRLLQVAWVRVDGEPFYLAASEMEVETES